MQCSLEASVQYIFQMDILHVFETWRKEQMRSDCIVLIFVLFLGENVRRCTAVQSPLGSTSTAKVHGVGESLAPNSLCLVSVASKKCKEYFFRRCSLLCMLERFAPPRGSFF